jgi:hypothetical protein
MGGLPLGSSGLGSEQQRREEAGDKKMR